MIKNEKEFLELIDRYESISIQEIEDTISNVKENNGGTFYMSTVKRAITGFGTCSTCTLCIATEVDKYFEGITYKSKDCSLCLYSTMSWYERGKLPCIGGDAEKTYFKIYDAENPEDLQLTYKERAEFMRNIYEIYKVNKHIVD